MRDSKTNRVFILGLIFAVVFGVSLVTVQAQSESIPTWVKNTALWSLLDV